MSTLAQPEAGWLARRSQQHQRDHRAQFNAGSPESQYQRDRARIIHSSWFRALQSKTQVLGLGEHDFHRTRLTHSMEVAQIGSGIVEYLQQDGSHHPSAPWHESVLAWLPPLSLIESICLAHDLGHPPFGHGGEVALNFCMLDHGGFEGNGQTLRILSKLGEFSQQDGIDVTRRTMLGVLKYPILYSEAARYAQSPPPRHLASQTRNLSAFHPPKCIFDDEHAVLDWLLDPFEPSDVEQFRQHFAAETGHAVSYYKSLDTSIMEIADDIAYGVHDLEDALALRLIRQEDWQSFIRLISQDPPTPLFGDIEHFSELLFSEQPKRRKHAISRLVHYLISATYLYQDTAFTHPLLRYQVRLEYAAALLLQRLKQFVMDHVIMRPELQALRHCGQQLTITLFDTLSSCPQELLPKLVFQDYQHAEHHPRIICDYLASLTDVSANKLHASLFTPNAGSVFQRL